MPWVDKFSCTKCDYESSTSVLWGGFLYIINRDNDTWVI
jgi:hypothetical protein